MCTMSMIMDHYHDKWGHPPYTTIIPAEPPIVHRSPSRDELDEFRSLLDRAREYDRRMNQPDCELQEKKDALKKLAKAMGVDISFVDEHATA